jgi:tRNA (guanine37-N1)-methyltransferase
MKLKDLLSNVLNENEMQKVVTSFDIVGDVAIIEIPRGLGKKERQIAEALMKIHKNVRVVVKKLGAMSGRYRIRKIKIIAGEKRTETIYKEHGCLMKLDVAKVYFSVRLSHERERIASLVNDGENVLVMFAGVGPFALIIAKKKPNAHVVGIELNPTAAKYFQENIVLNKLKNCESIKGDVRKVIPEKFVGWADRILMPLPKSADNFLDVAFIAAKNNAIIHFYYFAPEEKAFSEAEKKIKKVADNARIKIEILNKKIVRPYAPGIVQIVVDFKVKK